jgi:hypothetical protein
VKRRSQPLAAPRCDKNELIIEQEAVGCTVHASSTDGVIYSADGADCELSAIGMKQLGVRGQHFDTFTLDFQAKTWNYSGTIYQDSASGMNQPQCVQIATQLTGDLPLGTSG